MKKEALIEATLFSKFLNLIKKDHSQRYKGPEGKKTIDFERSLKKSWNDKVDRNFIESVKLVHWLVSGDPTKFLTTPRNNEISAEGYLPDEPTVSNYAKTQVGVLLDGYVTFAMRSGGGTGFFGGDDTPEEWKSSGTVKRAPESKANRIGQPILNKDSKFRSKGTYNEFIVDNWKPVALVAKGGLDNPFYKELYNYSIESKLPIIDENGNKVELQDPAEFSTGKKFSTGVSRLAKGALPESVIRLSESRLRQIILEEARERVVINEIKQVINEMNLDLTEEQRLILEKSVLDAIKSAAKKAALPITVMAALAFGSQVASNVQDLEGVGVTPAAAEQISNAVEAGQNMTDARLDFLKKSIEDSSREGEIPADLAKGVGGDDAKDIAMDRLEKEYVQQGNVESTGQAQAGSGYLIYVPYDSLPDGYKDTFTGGAEKEDLKRFYQTMDIQDLADKVRDFNSWGSDGHGQFYDSATGGQLLPASWSIAYKALQDKAADRGSKGKSTFKENT